MFGVISLTLYDDLHDVTCPQRVFSLLHFDFDSLEAFQNVLNLFSMSKKLIEK